GVPDRCRAGRLGLERDARRIDLDDVLGRTRTHPEAATRPFEQTIVREPVERLADGGAGRPVGLAELGLVQSGAAWKLPGEDVRAQAQVLLGGLVVAPGGRFDEK